MRSSSSITLAVVLALVGACDGVFGLRPTQLIDAAPPDAPFQCPALGTAPVFLAGLHEFSTRTCSFYSISAVTNRATAVCADDGFIEQGDLTGELQPTNLPAYDGVVLHQQPRSSAEGDEIWTQDVNYSTSQFRFEIHRRVSGTDWMASSTLPVTTSLASDSVSSPTARANGPRHVLFLDSSTSSLHELVEDAAGNWSETQVHAGMELGTLSISAVTLSRDGLRLILEATVQSEPADVMVFTDRASVADPFRPVSVLPTAPLAADGYLDDDCGRFYVSGLGAMFFVQQQ